MGQVNLIAAIIFGVGSLQGFIVAFNLILTKKGNRRANKVLALLMLAFSVLLLQNFIGVSGFYLVVPQIIFLFYPLNGLLGPLFFVYVSILLSPNRSYKPIELFHFTAFVILVVVHWEFLMSDPSNKIGAAEYIYFEKSKLLARNLYSIIPLRTHTLLYTLAAILLVFKNLKYYKANCSNTNIIHLNNFLVIAYLSAAFALLSIVLTIYAFVNEINLGMFEIYGHAINSIFMVAFAFLTIQFPERLFFTINENERPVQQKETKINIDLEPYQFMEENRLFLNPDLKLHDMAASMKVPAHVLSDQINKDLKMNFYDFVNYFRVEEFKKRVSAKAYAHFKILAVAFDVGFNSKSSFNRIFKKSTGMTPSQYLLNKQVSTSETEPSNR